MAQYRYLFYDLLTNRPKATLPLQGVSFGWQRNESGPFQGSISTRHSKANTDNITPGLTVIYVERNGMIIWGGILWKATVQSGTEKSTITLGAREIFSYYQEIEQRGRYIITQKEYVDEDQLFIARDLIDYAADTGIFAPASNPDIGVTTGTELTTDNGGTEQLRTEIYNHYERRNIGEAIRKLAALDNGFEFLIDIGVGIDGFPSREFKVFYPAVTDTAGIVLRYPINIESYTLTQNAGRQVNRAYAIGAGEGEAMLVRSALAPSSTPYARREMVRAYKDVSVDTTLQGKADNLLAQNITMSEIPTLVCKVNTQELQPGSFRMGARLEVDIRDGYVTFNKDCRVIQTDVRVDDDGVESMSLRVNDTDTIGE